MGFMKQFHLPSFQKYEHGKMLMYHYIFVTALLFISFLEAHFIIDTHQIIVSAKAPTVNSRYMIKLVILRLGLYAEM